MRFKNWSASAINLLHSPEWRSILRPRSCRGARLKALNMEPGPTQRLKVKIRDSEFEADGPPDVVQDLYQQWLDAVNAAPAPEPASSAAPRSPPLGMPAPSVDAWLDEPGPSVTITDELMSRVFRREGDSISLLALPNGNRREPDALITLLYGFQRLANMPAVTGVTLMQASRQSGVALPRIDRVLDSETDFIMAAGARRGRRYSLNNRGVRHAELLIKQLVE